MIATFISIFLACLLINHKKVSQIILNLFGVVQTIPSLAILGILIPIVGIGSKPSIIALVVYAIMPVFQNAYTGLNNIDPKLLVSAKSLGLSETFQLFHIKLPLAYKDILAGIRVSTVMTVGAATLASFVGGGGLGTFIMSGIQTNNNSEIIVGATISALLTLLFSFLINLISKISHKMVILTSISVLLIVSSLTLYNNFSSKKTITIAGKMGSEPEIIINMYKQLIQNSNNIDVVLKPNFGGTSFLYNALRNHSIDIYPEFTGTVIKDVLKTNENIPKNPLSYYLKSKNELKKRYDLVYLKPMKYQNRYCLAINKQDASFYNIKTISDLKNSSLTAGFDPDFMKEYTSNKGLRKTYNLKFRKVVSMDAGLKYKALNKKEISITDAYTTDSQLRSKNVLVLKDDKNFFPPYQGAPLVRNDFYNKNYKIVKSLKVLQNKITNKDMIRMNYLVNTKHQKASDVARKYLLRKKLIRN
ncbi:glycine betaine ABC transporter periplasmic protein [Apilactobacillus ozensis DSM 23829 = JCM 17196]|uniref:Glycine betaine ABC transporter periplasmic protein n=1 Tax=Apilactobacillus ozensis DSM 23829 = JCM 17196 TaxID=1423781 RepID=A0A0R2AXB3_9LACO|nr:glycine betaine ABC transporter periplasmic protein [Apilactobacillus ozensis DSM 23829 = JCM 17196]